MKAFALSLLFTLPLGWLAMGFFQSTERSASEPMSEPAASSLLGGRSRASVPLPAWDDTSALEGTIAFLRDLQEASPLTLERWIVELMGTGDVQKNYPQLTMVLQRYGELDGERAMAFLQGHSELTRFRGIVIGSWAGKDWKAAAEKVLELEPKGYLINSVMNGIQSDLDATLALHDFLKAEGFDKRVPGAFANLFSRLDGLGSEKVANLALEHMRAVPRSGPFGSESHGLVNVLSNWIRDDPEAALAWVEGRSKGSDKGMAMVSLISAWSDRDGVGALQNLWYHVDAQQREYLVNQLGNGNDGALDIGGLVDWLDAHVDSPDWRAKLMNGFANGLGNSHQNPQQLAELLPYLDRANHDGKHAIRRAAGRWAEVDMAGLETWLDSVDDNDVRAAVVGGIIRELASNDPDKAMAYVNDPALNSDLAEALSSYDLRRLITSASDRGKDAHEVLHQLPENLHDKALEGYVESVAQKDPAGAVRHLLSIPESETRDRSIQQGVSHWAQQEPEAAAAWVSDLAEGEMRTYATANLVNNWARSDLEGAMTWVEEQGPSASRDAATVALARAQSHSNPEAAWELLQTLGPAEDHGYRRDGAIHKTLTALAQRNPQRAEEALSQVEVSEPMRESLEKAVHETIALHAHFAQP